MLNYRKTFDRQVVEIPHQIIRMRDGCELSARLWLPVDASSQPVPAIVEHLPYRKRDGTIARDELTHPWFAGHGYACIRVDMRGNGDSQGLMSDEYTEQELDDACQVIAWASAQSFCNGKVGMMGISWGGFNSLQVAARCPPALKAIITLCSTVDRFADDIHYKGGCLLGENVGWAANMLSYSSRPPDPMLVGDQWRKLWLERLENMPFLASIWLAHQRRDDYWKHGSVCENYPSMTAAVLSIGGWHDGYRNTISHLVTNVQAPVKGIVGPWIHKYPHYAGPQPAIGFLQEACRWWDRWLKDVPTGVESDPDYRVWLMDSVAPKRWLPERPGRWVAENSWPSNNIEIQAWTLCESRGDKHEGSVGYLEATKNAALASSTRVLNAIVNSAQTCGQAGGEYFPFAFGPELPDEQSADDAQSVVFDSPALVESQDIIGAPTVTFSLKTLGTAGNLVVRLCDLRPDGASALITMGLLNLKHHQSFETPQRKLEPGIVDVSLALDQIAYRIPKGHRLRVAVSSAYWPFIWPSPEACGFLLTSGNLDLPVRSGMPATHDEVSFEAPEAAKPWHEEPLRDSTSTRDVLRDDVTGMVSTHITNDFGESRDMQHGLVSGSATHERWSIHPQDPLSAEVVIRWEQNGGRDEWQWSTSVVMSMTCDAQHFYLSGHLVAREGQEEVFEAEYSDAVVRSFV